MTAQICVQISVVSGLIPLKITCKLLPFEDGKSIRAPQGGTIPKYLEFFSYQFKLLLYTSTSKFSSFRPIGCAIPKL